MSRILTRAGFTLTTVDVDEIQVNYPSAFELMQDLHSMGEGNAVLTRYLLFIQWFIFLLLFCHVFMCVILDVHF